MYGQYNKVDLPKALKLRTLGINNSIIAKRLDVTPGAIYCAFPYYTIPSTARQNPAPRKAHDLLGLTLRREFRQPLKIPH